MYDEHTKYTMATTSPMQHCKELLAVFLASVTFMFVGTFGTVIMIGLLFTRYCFISILYGLWMVFDWHTPRRGSRVSSWCRNWSLWQHYINYFPIQLKKTAELDPAYNYIICYQPHGLFCAGLFGTFATEGCNVSRLFPGIRFIPLVSSMMMNLPFARDYNMRYACDVSESSISYLFEKHKVGMACVLAIGGAREAMEAHPGRTSIILKKRRGFCRLALKYGAHLVPVYSFGDNDIYTQIINNPTGSLLRRLQNQMVKYIGVPFIPFCGRAFLPYRRPINTIVGRPIPVEKMTSPSEEDIDSLHSEYTRQLQQLFDSHKSNYEGYEEKELVIL
ncbi:2-acylglycerol O-acyltransferase 2-B-like [Glandiceps talaboti]